MVGRNLSATPAYGLQGSGHCLKEPALLATAGKRDALVDDVQAGGAQRLLDEIADVDLDRDHLSWAERCRARDETGHVGRELLSGLLRVWFEVDQEHAAVGQASQLTRLLRPRSVSSTGGGGHR